MADSQNYAQNQRLSGLSKILATAGMISALAGCSSRECHEQCAKTEYSQAIAELAAIPVTRDKSIDSLIQSGYLKAGKFDSSKKDSSAKHVVVFEYNPKSPNHAYQKEVLRIISNSHRDNVDFYGVETSGTPSLTLYRNEAAGYKQISKESLSPVNSIPDAETFAYLLGLKISVNLVHESDIPMSITHYDKSK